LRLSRYAEGTDVAPEKSRMEIERIVTRYGATNFFYGTEPDRANVGFRAHDRWVKFTVRLPLLTDPEVAQVKSTTTVRGDAFRDRTPKEAEAAREKIVRQRWRALALGIKAKLELVETGIETFEEAFLAQVMLPEGGTVGDKLIPRIAEAYKSGRTPELLQLAAPP
jgi:hypothetical protein